MPDPAGVPALAGTLAHRILELLFAEEPTLRTVDRARELARVAWPETEADDDFVALELDTAGVRDFKWHAWRAVEGLWTLEDPSNVEVQATEQRIEADVAGVPFIGIVDRLDRVDGALIVTDYKSGKPPAAAYVDQKLDQVLLYAAAVEALTNEQPRRAQLLYLGRVVIDVDVSEDNIGRATGGLSSTWDSLRAAADEDLFEPSTGPLCGWCPYVESCPEGQAEIRHRIETGRIRSSAPALRLVA